MNFENGCRFSMLLIFSFGPNIQPCFFDFTAEFAVLGTLKVK
jgi:hypothetical protein